MATGSLSRREPTERYARTRNRPPSVGSAVSATNVVVTRSPRHVRPGASAPTAGTCLNEALVEAALVCSCVMVMAVAGVYGGGVYLSALGRPLCRLTRGVYGLAD